MKDSPLGALPARQERMKNREKKMVSEKIPAGLKLTTSPAPIQQIIYFLSSLSCLFLLFFSPFCSPFGAKEGRK